MLTCAGQVYGWLRQATGSVYPAVLTHTAFNCFLGIAEYGTAATNPGALAAVGREAGIVTLVVIAATALWVRTWRTQRAVASPVASPVAVTVAV